MSCVCTPLGWANLTPSSCPRLAQLRAPRKERQGYLQQGWQIRFIFGDGGTSTLARSCLECHMSIPGKARNFTRISDVCHWQRVREGGDWRQENSGGIQERDP